MNNCSIRLLAVVGLALASAGSAYGFGAAGHSIAGTVATSRLCAQASEAIARLGQDQSLGQLSRWADQIRSVPAWEHTAPWHYMNVPDGESLARYRTPESGDVLWAIDEFTRRLGDERLAREQRLNALRFVVHFVVDIHQPLHVGRAADRGGNAVTFRVDGRRTNLHRLWDSDIIARELGPQDRYTASVMALARAHADEWAEAPPLEWATESKQLRAFVYDFDGAPGARYFDEAGRLLQRQLARAGVRLAATLNGIFCEPQTQQSTR